MSHHPHWMTFTVAVRSQAGHIPTLAWIVRECCAAAGRRCLSLAAAVAVTVAVSRGGEEGYVSLPAAHGRIRVRHLPAPAVVLVRRPHLDTLADTYAASPG